MIDFVAREREIRKILREIQDKNRISMKRLAAMANLNESTLREFLNDEDRKLNAKNYDAVVTKLKKSKLKLYPLDFAEIVELLRNAPRQNLRWDFIGSDIEDKDLKTFVNFKNFVEGGNTDSNEETKEYSPVDYSFKQKEKTNYSLLELVNLPRDADIFTTQEFLMKKKEEFKKDYSDKIKVFGNQFPNYLCQNEFKEVFILLLTLKQFQNKYPDGIVEIHGERLFDPAKRSK